MASSDPVAEYFSQVSRLLRSGADTEHSYRSAVERLVESLIVDSQAINEPRREKYGAPDFVVQWAGTPIGHIEAKPPDSGLDTIVADSARSKPRLREGEQLQRYRGALPNLLFTDGLLWYWFVEGEPQGDPLRVARWDEGRKRLIAEAGADRLGDLLERFATRQVATVRRPKELAERLARHARWLRDVIVQALTEEPEQGELHAEMEAFQKTLLPTLTPEQFADMYAQTIVYGLFTARVEEPDKPDFRRQDAAVAIPRTNPFLRKLFQRIAGYDLDPRIAWLVDDTAHLLARTDMGEVLRDFGKATRQQDPVVHFYETFLAAYNPTLREQRGVYYTPEPVVSYIVRSVDVLLRTHFGKPDGLANPETIILDPATGTATFLHAVVQEIYTTLQARGMAGAWEGYVREKLLPRLFGFELLMAPYTVAHLKLGNLLRQYGYEFSGGERLGIYLTNALADLPKAQRATFEHFIVEEARAANKIKRDKPVMVVLGNPPYSGHSANTGAWIDALLRGTWMKEEQREDEATPRIEKVRVESYYEVDRGPLGERNPKWLQDDYVKFIRFGQWRVGKTGEGVLAYISNNSYLDNPTFRGMRQSLLTEFDEIYLLNLHGNVRKKERTPEGDPDQNVFDIQQGVAIGLFVKRPAHPTVVTQSEITAPPATVFYADLWGERNAKYEELAEQHVGSTKWDTIKPDAPWYLLVPQDQTALEEYKEGWKVTEAMPVNVLGFQTHRDNFAIAFEREEIQRRIEDMRNKTISDSEFRGKYGVRDNRDWQLAKARVRVQTDPDWENDLLLSLYRPFDRRYCYFSEIAMDYPRGELQAHLKDRDNLSLLVPRQTSLYQWQHALVTEAVVESCAISSKTKEQNYVFPLYIYPPPGDATRQRGLFEAQHELARRANFSEEFIADVERTMGLRFISDGRGDLEQTVGPEDIFHYAYAIFHAPSYRERYAEFLKIDFPRLPLTSDVELSRALAAKGAELIDLHLLRLPGSRGVGGAGGAAVLQTPVAEGVRFPEGGTDEVGRRRYVPPQHSEPGRVYINKTQFFEGIEPETWEMSIGGYQPLDKWLKDRKGRTLTFDDIQHYMRMVIALRHTRRLMAEIDGAIPGWPLEKS